MTLTATNEDSDISKLPKNSVSIPVEMEEIVQAVLPVHPIRADAVDKTGITEGGLVHESEKERMGIPSEVLELYRLELLFSAFNACLTAGDFP